MNICMYIFIYLFLYIVIFKFTYFHIHIYINIYKELHEVDFLFSCDCVGLCVSLQFVCVCECLSV